MRSIGASLLALVALGAAACHLISGVSDLDFVDPTSSTGATGGAGGTILTTAGGEPTSSSSSVGGGGGGAAGGAAGGGATGGTGGSGGDPTECLVELTDDFPGTELDGDLWWISYDAFCDRGVNQGHFYVTPLANTPQAWVDLSSNATYDLTECGVIVQLRSALSQAEPSSQTALQLWPSSWTNSVAIMVEGGQIGARQVTDNSETTLSSIAYEPTNHKWLRLRGHGGQLYFEASKDTTSWTILHAIAAPDYLDSTHVVLSAGTWFAGMATPGTAEFDRVNLPPP